MTAELVPLLETYTQQIRALTGGMIPEGYDLKVDYNHDGTIIDDGTQLCTTITTNVQQYWNKPQCKMALNFKVCDRLIRNESVVANVQVSEPLISVNLVKNAALFSEFIKQGELFDLFIKVANITYNVVTGSSLQEGEKYADEPVVITTALGSDEQLKPAHLERFTGAFKKLLYDQHSYAKDRYMNIRRQGSGRVCKLNRLLPNSGNDPIRNLLKDCPLVNPESEYRIVVQPDRYHHFVVTVNTTHVNMNTVDPIGISCRIESK